ncbi:MAG TPA: hypothetical protein VNJ07_03480 [Chitinophagales bacterium]|nr:hypothetical protein [Chitinophagales bacterium]
MDTLLNRKLNNELKYHFSDFTYENYDRLLCFAKKKYVFRTYENFHKSENFIIWRHDVDFSVHSAYELAKIEAENKVQGVYFFHLHSEYYNLLEQEITTLVKKIIELDHHIGIHFDSHYYKIRTENDIEQYLIFEKNIIERLFSVEVKVFSFHNTNDFVMGCQKWKYAGLINTYAEYFQKEVGYCSDSNGHWIYDRLEDLLASRKHQRLQVLTHPVWWQKEVMSPKQRVWKYIDDWAAHRKQQYLLALSNLNRLCIDW